MDHSRRPDVVTVLVNRVDGGVTVLRVIVTEYRPSTEAEREAGAAARVPNWTVDPTPEYIEGIIAKHAWTGGLAKVSWRLVPNDFVDEQTDRHFRNAWKDDGGHKPGVHMPKAREIHRENLRRLRAPLLEAADVSYMRADESGDQQEKKRIGERKRALRDVTDDPAIEAAQTPEELKAVMPEALRG
jgi:hypothetical protein